jgi:hypothetical protein
MGIKAVIGDPMKMAIIRLADYDPVKVDFITRNSTLSEIAEIHATRILDDSIEFPPTEVEDED